MAGGPAHTAGGGGAGGSVPSFASAWAQLAAGASAVFAALVEAAMVAAGQDHGQGGGGDDVSERVGMLLLLLRRRMTMRQRLGKVLILKALQTLKLKLRWRRRWARTCSCHGCRPCGCG